jgi:hypothetical protein
MDSYTQIQDHWYAGKCMDGKLVLILNIIFRGSNDIAMNTSGTVIERLIIDDPIPLM